MSQPFVAQIQPFGFNFAPRFWAQCNGQLLSIAQNTALFSLVGTYYGGNGTSTFALPNLQSRTPLSQGTYNGEQFVIGEMSGVENVTLTMVNLPAHTHNFLGSSSAGNRGNPIAGAALANSTLAPAENFYGAFTGPMTLNPASVSMVGNGQAHANIQPYLAVNWCIAMSGVYPSRN